MLYTLIFMDKELRLVRLFELYGNLLTEHQRELFNLYYECDLSLGEIAEIKAISRQSVNDALKKSREILLSTEEKLGFASRLDRFNEYTSSVDSNVDVNKLLSDIKSILEDG